MSKIRLAEYHYRKAVEIHPKNAVLLGCVGMVRLQSNAVNFRRRGVNVSALFIVSQAVERRRDREAALALFNEAVQLAPENALVRYRRAKILISMRKYQVSQEELICVVDPDFFYIYSLRWKTWSSSGMPRLKSQM